MKLKCCIIGQIAKHCYVVYQSFIAAKHNLCTFYVSNVLHGKVLFISSAERYVYIANIKATLKLQKCFEMWICPRILKILLLGIYVFTLFSDTR